MYFAIFVMCFATVASVLGDLYVRIDAGSMNMMGVYFPGFFMDAIIPDCF